MKISVERSDLLRSMSRAQAIVERRTTIPILSNVLIEAREDRLTLRATDLDIELLDSIKAVVEKEGAVTVGAHTFYEILRKLPDGSRVLIDLDPLNQKINVKAGRSTFSLTTEDIVNVSVSETKIRFSNSTLSLTSKVVDGSFPDYDRVIPKNNIKKLVIDASEFAKSVDRVATISSERARAVKLSLSKEKLILSVNAPETGLAIEEIPVAYEGEEIEIGFNAKYLQEISNQVESGEAIFLFNDVGDPALMKDNNDDTAVYVVMPMRV